MEEHRNGELKITAEHIIDEAYNRGKNDAKREISLSGEYERIYQRGLDDAWKAAKKSVYWWADNEGGVKVFKELFNSWAVDKLFKFSASEAIEKIKKYEQEHAPRCNNCRHKDDQFSACSGCGDGSEYETETTEANCGECHRRYYCEASPDSCFYAKQAETENEIKVGDEVYLLDERYPRVVIRMTKTDGANAVAFQLTKSGKWCANDVRELNKTGRHFDQIQEVLNTLKEVQE